jgi:hypothetical protein
MPQVLLVKDESQKPKQYMATKVFKAVQDLEHKYGEKTAALAIVAMVIYLVIAQ